MYRPVLVTGPSTEPVTLTEAKAACRIDTSDDDDLVTSLIVAARQRLDAWSGILRGVCLITQSWRQDYEDFCEAEYNKAGDADDGIPRLRLPLFPVVSITSVKYYDVDGNQQTINGNYYSLQTDGLGAFVQFLSTYSFASVYSEPPTVSVEYVAGYGTAANVPMPIKVAMKMMIAHWYENREAVVVGNSLSVDTLPMAVMDLLEPYRRRRV